MKRTRSKSRWLVALLLGVSVLLVVSSYYQRGVSMPVSYVRGAAKSVTWGAAAAVEAVVSPLRAGFGDVTHFWRLRRDKARLQASIVRLNARLVAAGRLEKENSDLRRAARFLPRIKMRVLGATLVQRSGNPWESVLLVDRGEKDGIKSGSPVLAQDGVIGRVIGVGKGVSEVRLIDDQRSGVAVEVERTGAQAVVTGSAAGILKLRYQAGDADIKKGDRLITSGVGSTFPRGLDVGTVVKIDTGIYGLEKDIVVQPRADLRRAAVMFIGLL